MHAGEGPANARFASHPSRRALALLCFHKVARECLWPRVGLSWGQEPDTPELPPGPLRPSHGLGSPSAKLLGRCTHALALGPGWRVVSRGCPQLCPLPCSFRPREGSKENGGARSKRALEEEEGGTDVLSKNKQKKQLRNPHKTFDPSLKRKLRRGERWGAPRRGCCVKARSPACHLLPGRLGLPAGLGHRGRVQAHCSAAICLCSVLSKICEV